MPLSTGTRLGPYEILTPVGAGGMGEVYKAKDTGLDRTVAIKVLPPHTAENPEARQRFERKAGAVFEPSIRNGRGCSGSGETARIWAFVRGGPIRRRISWASALVAAGLFVAPGGPSYAQGLITTIAGNGRFLRGDGGPASAAQLGQVWGTATDASGNVYATDQTNHLLVKISPAGTLTVVAGNNIAGYSGDGGPATSAALNTPFGVTVDKDGNVYVADTSNQRIRKITPDGIITTVAGNGIRGFGGDGGPAVNARLSQPQDVAVDSAGNLYIADWANNRIRRVSPTGTITTVAGSGMRGFSGDGGQATSASLQIPSGVDVDEGGNVYIADYGNFRIRKVSPEGTITTVAGNGQTAGPSLDGGPAVNAPLGFPTSVTVDSDGTFYVPDNTRGSIRKINPSGIITTVAGSGGANPGDGGPATAAALNVARQVALFAGSFYIAESGAGRVRQVNPGGVISTIAGTGLGNFSGDGGPGQAAALSLPYGVALDAAGNLYIADVYNHRIRKLALDGQITTVAGTGRAGFSGDNGPAINAGLNTPRGVGVDAAGNLYIADTSNSRIRKVTPVGGIATIAGGSGQGFSGDGGPATSARLSLPWGVTLDGSGNLYVADYSNQRVRKISTAGIITTVAGNGVADLSGDGGLATGASLAYPTGVAVDAAGNLYIADRNNNRVRKVTPEGIITTVAGAPAGITANGAKAAEVPIQATGISLDSGGNLYLAGEYGHRIYKVSPEGILTIVAGSNAPGCCSAVPGYAGDGGKPTSAQLNLPTGVAVDSTGNIYIADSGNDRIREILAGPPSLFAAPAAVNFTATAGATDIFPKQITLLSRVSGLAFTAASSGGDWLSFSPSAGSTPAQINVSLDAGALAPGAYRGSITITAPDAEPKTQTVEVALTITAANPPRLVAESAGLSFALNQGAAPGSAPLTVANRGSGTLEFGVSVATDSGGRWLSAAPPGGSLTSGAPVALTVAANPAGLGAGTYTGRVLITSPLAGQGVTVPVTMTVSAVRQTILLSQTGLTFTAVASGGVVPPQTFGVLNTRQGAMAWTAVRSTLSGGANWLTVSPASGTSQAGALKVPLVEVGVQPAGLAPGDYYGQIRVIATGADNSPQVVSVVLKVLPAGSNPGPVVRPTGLISASVAGASPPGSQEVLISNLTDTPLPFTSGRLTLDGKDWFVSVPVSETVSPSSPTRLVVQTDTTILTPGIRRGVLTLLFADGSVQAVNLLSVVLGSSTAKGAVAAEECVPTTLLPLFTALAANSTAVAGWPTPVEVKVVDDCGDPMVRGSVVAAFSNGDGALPLAPLGEGKWSGTWQPRRSATAGVTVTVTAQIPDLRVRGTVQATVGVQANPSVPVVGQAALVNAASFGPQAVTAPGSIISIFGSRLSDGEAQAKTLPLQTELGGVTVAMAGQPLPLLYVSGQQVNAVIPYGIQTNAQHQVVVRRGDSYSVPENITVAAAQPAMFTLEQSGRGQGLIFLTRPNGFVLADGANPAQARDVVVVYATGLGEVNPAVATGAAAPGLPLSRVVTPVEARIGGRDAAVQFAGLAPGFVGLYQVNVEVPPGVEPSPAATLVLLQNGAPSNTVTLAVR